MWDNAALLRNIANWLFGFSVCALLYGAIYYVTHLPGLLPLHSVRLMAKPQRVDTGEVLQVVRNEVKGNFFTVNIRQLRHSLEEVPWVRGVDIRRDFPSSLEVQLEEHQALAHWNNSALVNRQGEVFAAQSKQVLPGFVGPDGSAAEVTQYYTQFEQQLAGLDLQVEQIVLTPRHAWQLHLSNGMVLELGREDVQQRLARFVKVYPYSLAAIQQRVKYVDLRYRNGFAVGGLGKQG
ncbi:MAG TPA: cell division protein FtsQ/DivIB [Gallionella sp.]|nr:cell division protein FtsQ/DivIB [Gallionella sp.]